MGEPVGWAVVAQNLAEHAANRIHTDEGAREAGFPSALVAGVTTYAYLTHPLVAAWGIDWVARGGASMRFRAPVFAGRTIECIPSSNPDDTWTVRAVDATEEQNPRSIEAWRDSGSAAPLRDGEPLADRQFVLDGEFGPDYGSRAGDDLTIYDGSDLIHPAVWPALANRVFSTDLVRGSWIHTRSIVRHHGVARRGDTVDVAATVVDRFERHGERAVVDLRISLRGRPIASLEHEAIIALPD
ncbi:MAG: MaoC family dehydratase [Ilumatobacteraceae bacterium]